MSDKKFIKLNNKKKELQNLFSWNEFYRERKHLNTHKQVKKTQIEISQVKNEINELMQKK